MVIAEKGRASHNQQPSIVAASARLQEAVQRAQEGDVAGFYALVEELGPQVYRFLVVRLGHEGDAKDALQETLISAWRGLPGLRRPERVRSWIMTIAARKAAETFRTRPPLVDAPEREPAAPDPFGLIEIREALDALPSGMRDALVAHCVLGFSEQETAHLLDVPVGTVKSRVSRARRTFASLLFAGPTSLEEKGEQDAPTR